MPATASINYWPDSACARAFWGQQELPPYQELLAATAEWLDPRPRERWLDLGCGGGRLTRVLWEKSRGRIAEIVGLDCAAENARAFQKLRAELRPPRDQAIRFVAADFVGGMATWPDEHFDGIVSGLAIHYADSFCEATGRWTTEAYDRVLDEAYRLLRPGGAFVFSVNVPDPAWSAVAWQSLRGVWRTRRPIQYLKRAWRMWSYGSWLTHEARRGRFHYLPRAVVLEKLNAVGFGDIEHRVSYARQAFLIRCAKPAT